MKLFALFLIRPDFMQVLLVSGLLFLLPLEKQTHWQRNALCIIGLCWILGSALELLSYQITTHLIFWAVLFAPPPLLCTWLLFRNCTHLSPREAVYGTACAYAAQHITFCVTAVLFGSVPISATAPWSYLVLWAIDLTLLWTCGLVFGRPLARGGRYDVSHRQTLVMAGLVLGVALQLNLLIRGLASYYGNSQLYALGLVYDMLCCILVLWLQVEQRVEVDWKVQAETERRLRNQMQEQYELFRTNMDLINRKCHDLRHQVAALRIEHDPAIREEGLRDMEQAVMIYDSAVQTGNKVLDTVLTQQSLVCEQEHISWTCMADGALLGFMKPVDLYTLFGNALDNAIDSVRQVDDPQRRTVAVTVCRQHGMALIQIENYYDHGITMKDGLPATTKENADQHGYGLKSIAGIAAQYGGTIRIQTDEDIFILSVLLPLLGAGCDV